MNDTRVVMPAGFTQNADRIEAAAAYVNHHATANLGKAYRTHSASLDSLEIVRDALDKLAMVAPPTARVQFSYPFIHVYWTTAE